MPTLPKSKDRPWLGKKKEHKPQQGRKVTNPFYHKPAWRKFRAIQKTQAIEKAREKMMELIHKGENPLPKFFYMEELKPLCAQCLRGNVFGPIYREGKVLDHIKPINPNDAYDTKDGLYGEPLDPENVEFKCHACHNKKSAAEVQFHKEVRERL